MKKIWISIIVIIIIAAGVIVFFVRKNYKQETQQQPISQTEPDVVISTPQKNDLVTSPLTVSGKAKGNWFFEANLPVVLKDQNGNILAQKGFHSLGDWTAMDYVNFSDTLTFSTPQTEYGVLIIQNDNASGDPTYDKSYAVVVRFK
jgi:hypothetical protein